MATELERRHFLRIAAGSAAGAAAWGMGLPSVFGDEPAGGKRPNIVFVLTDDQRFDAMSCAGHPWLKTPNMDRLAREGVRFSNAFVTTSLCSPSRASFLTGCYAHKHKVVGNHKRAPDKSCPTFAQVLQKGGYETAFIGKWHMGTDDKPRPGFDHWISFKGQGKYTGGQFNTNGKRSKAKKYITDELTDHAIEFVRKSRKKPFMLYLSHKAVHAPFTPPKRHAGLYGDKPIPAGSDPNERLDDKVKWGRKKPKGWLKNIRDYMRALTTVDEQLGRLLKTLEEQKILDDTVIVFAGDNGYFFGEHGGLWDKRAAYEPSIRVPLLMRYPKIAKAGTVCDDLTLNIDLAPTLLELAGAKAPTSVQGLSWVGTLKGKSKGRESFLYEYFHEKGDRFKRPSVLAVRTKQWKYITYPSVKGGVVELYDLKQDPGELRNLAPDPNHARTLNRMKAELERLKRETGYVAKR